MKLFFGVFFVLFLLFYGYEKNTFPNGNEVLIEMEKEFLKASEEKGLEGWLSFFQKILQFSPKINLLLKGSKI